MKKTANDDGKEKLCPGPIPNRRSSGCGPGWREECSKIFLRPSRKVAAVGLQNRSASQPVRDKIEDGTLVCSDGRYLYPMRRNIPILLVDEAIAL